MVMGNLAIAQRPLAPVTGSYGRDHLVGENRGCWRRSSGRTNLCWPSLSGTATGRVVENGTTGRIVSRSIDRTSLAVDVAVLDRSAGW